MDLTYRVKVGILEWIVQSIPESLFTDTVKVVILRLSDAYTWNFITLAFENSANSAAMTFISDIDWKQSFTPPSLGKYIVKIHDETLDVKYRQYIDAVSTVDPIVSVAAITDTTAAAMLTAVNNAITVRMNGGAVQAYTINNRNIQYMTLSELLKLRRELQTEVANKDSSGGRTFAGFDR